MNTPTILDPESWAKQTFGQSRLKDLRRTGRAVLVAGEMAKNPSGSLPEQMRTWKGTIALYRLLSEDEVSFEALMQPHCPRDAQRDSAPHQRRKASVGTGV